MRTLALVLASTLAAGSAAAQHAGHDQPTGTVRTAARGSARPAVAGRLVSIEAKEYGFTAPDTIPAGLTTLRLSNAGQELHHAWLARLDGGHGLADLEAAMKTQGPPPAWVVDVGGPNAVVHGETADVTVSLAPGNYVLLCFVPGADGVPHMMKGMVKPLVVVGKAGAKEAALPAASNTITLTDYGFGFAKPLAAGPQTIRIRNAAAQPHEILIVALAPGKTPMEVVAWTEKMEGPPPGKPVGGITGLAAGGEMSMATNLAPGRYGLICFVPDAKDGKPHFAHGMTREFEVK